MAWLLAIALALAGEELGRATSAYGTARVELEDGVRVLSIDGSPQSAWDPDDPERLPYAYSQLMLQAIRGWPGEHGDVLIIGLGGGTLARALRDHHRVWAVEIDPAVVKLARRFFDVRGVRVRIADGRRFLETTRRRFDVVVVDAASEAGVPEILRDVGFVRAARARLAPEGQLVANSWARAPFAAEELQAWTSVLGPPHVLHVDPDSGEQNRVLAWPHLPAVDEPHQLDVE